VVSEWGWKQKVGGKQCVEGIVETSWIDDVPRDHGALFLKL
jgi:hypothetical protein